VGNWGVDIWGVSGHLGSEDYKNNLKIIFWTSKNNLHAREGVFEEFQRF